MPWIIGDATLIMVPVTLVLLVIGGYIAKRGVTSYFNRASYQPMSESIPPSQTKFCPECGNPIEAGSMFCGNCGASIETGVQTEQLTGEESSIIGRALAMGKDLQKKVKRTDLSQITDRAQTIQVSQDSGEAPFMGRIVAVLGTVLLIVSGFLPWAKSSYDTLKGFGDPVLSAVIVLAIVAILAMQFKKWSWPTLIIGILATAFGIWVRDPEKLVSFMSGFSLPEIKYGLYVYILGSLILLVGGILGMLKK